MYFGRLIFGLRIQQYGPGCVEIPKLTSVRVMSFQMLFNFVKIVLLLIAQ